MNQGVAKERKVVRMDKVYIEREAAIIGLAASSLTPHQIDDAAEAIQLVPTADVVEVRHGRWKLHEDGSGTCQECGCRQKYVWDMDGWQNYCGHCGADMRNGGGRTILQSL